MHLICAKSMTFFIDAHQLKLPSGLVNLGNTCYLASTVQCLRAVPELEQAITKYAAIYIGI